MTTDHNVAITAEMQGTIVTWEVTAGTPVRQGQVLGMLESMKLHHDIVAPTQGVLSAVAVEVGSTVKPGDVIASIDASSEAQDGSEEAAEEVSASGPLGLDRPDLSEVVERHAIGLDEARPRAVERRRERGHRTARENVEDLIDDGSLVEYGPLVLAAQRKRRELDDLIENTPADGLVGGIASVNGDQFEGHDAQCVVMSYDYSVLAGTQGHQNHRKKDRLFELAEELRLPVVFFTEGGGGRPGDTDTGGVTGLDCYAFLWWGQLSGTVPMVGVNSGYCFAGNAAILGCCDVVIATRDSNIGMGGPAMIEGGGLGVYEPKEIGPTSVQSANGVIDILVEDEAEAVEVARKYLSYFQGAIDDWSCSDQTALRDVIPVDRLRAYDVRNVIDGMFDDDSVLEIRKDFGVGMITALARVEGRPVGVIANNPAHLAGAIDSDGADKAARFMQLCDAHGLPIITLIDTPGMMVGPDVEQTALVRHCSRLFVTGANVMVPVISVVLRKSYGLGAQAMMGGSTKAPLACLAWPTGEFGGMGLEGYVRLGYRKELEAAGSPEEEEQLFRQLVDRLYEHGKALSIATWFEIDDVIDPADTRRWLSTLLRSVPPQDRTSPTRPQVDTW
ncbi:MAG TPA: biotin carboxylase [Acidimicrobiaceae bacterium]|nr:biotin carboxylase [Acidimicrobiaceae bacterium]